ncbi:MAG: SDR family oxidoreductase [Pelagibacteraceae bacterium]|jgi:NAD(P)-dependent dehydrogenase (short-subunit alcohol dehydrogenase family)
MILKNKNVVITGAASGIGLGLVKRFAKEDLNSLHLLDISPNIFSIATQYNANGYMVDVTNEEQVAIVIKKIIENDGSIDIYCSNAGYQKLGTLDISNDEWDKMWQINVMSHVYAARNLFNEMIKNKGGYFLITVSAAGLLNMNGSLGYATTKHAAVGLAENFSIMYDSKGIKISILCPQLVDTDMLRLADNISRDHPLFIDGILSPEEVAECALKGIEDESFLILPHQQVKKYIQFKSADYEKWLKSFSQLVENEK